MSKLVMNIKNEQNMKAMVEWCKQFHIEYQVIEDVKMPALVDEKNSTPVKPVATKSEDKFPAMKADATYGVITFNDELLAVRNWDSGKVFRKEGKTVKETMEGVRYATKKAITEAGGKWDDTIKAYKFSTKKAYNAFKKAQKEYSEKKEA